MKKITILPVIIAFIAIVAFAPQDAHAATAYTAIGNGNWNDASNWDVNGVPITTGPGDTITISGFTLTITSGLTISNGGDMGGVGHLMTGHIIIASGGVLRNFGTFTVDLGGILDNNGNTIKALQNQGHLINHGTINSHGLFENRGIITNYNLIDNFNEVRNANVIDNQGTFKAECKSVYTPGPGSQFLHNGILSLGCPQIPEFPIPFSMVIIFAAVAAVYMGIRQKMLPGFKSF